MEAFGPIPSRRLGRSLGINHIPAKFCTYACVYCQVGPTSAMQIRRQVFFDPEEVFDVVRRKVDEVRAAGEDIDFLSFVPDGEPTLDVNLGREIERVKTLGIPTAVLTNSSLIDDPDVQNDLMKADLVSLKIDAVRTRPWRLVDRPQGRLRLDSILEGIQIFAERYEGRLITETLLVHRTNDYEEDVAATADFIAGLGAETSYILIPTRPPTEDWVRPPSEEAINRAYQLFSQRIAKVECLIGFEGDGFSATGDVERDLLAITSVHPMRESAVREVLARSGADWAVVDELVARGDLAELHYDGSRFYLRKVARAQRDRKQSHDK
jgi:wyosine [tRNA(Phe)-imidazoG37] synthetase (radical SAM superfamily)